MKRGAFTIALLGALAAAPLAGAQDPSVQEARTLFNAGAQAYEAGQFPAAIQAFEQAYKLAKRDAIVFSVAQAYKRQYYIDKKPDNLRMAMQRYREYLANVPTGGRSADAAQALAELEPIAVQLATNQPEAAPAPPAPAAMPTRLMVSSRTKDAKVSVDGGPMQEMPLIAEVKPGKHRIRVVANGRFDEDREVAAAEGGIVALDIPLRDKPALLTFAVEDGVQVQVDGRPAGTTPLSTPVELAPGTHLLTLTKNGRHSHTEEIELGRGERRQIRNELSATGQRAASYVLMGTGAAALAAGGVFTVLAMHQQTEAKNIESEAQSGNITTDRLVEHNESIDRRDRWRLAAGISLGSGLLLGATGTLLYAFDHPSVEPLTIRSNRQSEGPDESPAAPSLELSAVPLVGPGFTGGSVGMRF